MTLIETVDYARYLLNEPLDSNRTFYDGTSSFFADSALVNYFNQAQREIQSVIVQAYENYFVTHSDINIVAGTDEYALHSQVMKIVRVEYIGDNNINSPEEIYPITFNEKEYYHNANLDVTALGTVQAYALKDKSFVLRPRPEVTQNCAVRYYFIKVLSDLTASGAISEIPIQFHEVLGLGITVRAMIQQEGTTDSYTVINNRYREMIENIKLWAENYQVQRPRSVRRVKRWG